MQRIKVTAPHHYEFQNFSPGNWATTKIDNEGLNPAIFKLPYYRIHGLEQLAFVGSMLINKYSQLSKVSSRLTITIASVCGILSSFLQQFHDYHFRIYLGLLRIIPHCILKSKCGCFTIFLCLCWKRGEEYYYPNSKWGMIADDIPADIPWRKMCNSVLLVWMLNLESLRKWIKKTWRF